MIGRGTFVPFDTRCTLTRTCLGGYLKVPADEESVAYVAAQERDLWIKKFFQLHSF